MDCSVAEIPALYLNNTKSKINGKFARQLSEKRCVSLSAVTDAE
jgi:hypothetical protein